MSDQFIGEIKLISFNFPPRGWALCNGQLLPINQNQALFSILGTTYGGDGRTNFALPDLRGRAPVHAGGGTTNLGERGGEESHTLTFAELPAHGHMRASADQATSASPAGLALAAKPRRGVNRYTAPGSPVQINDGGVPVGGSQPHPNLQPFLVMSYVIALQGIFPSRN